MKKIVLATAIASAITSAAHAGDLYVGGGLGVSFLDPKVVNLDYEDSHNRDFAGGVTVGYVWDNGFGVEAAYSWLGTADVDGVRGNHDQVDVDYETATLMVTYGLHRDGIYGGVGGSRLYTDFSDTKARHFQDHQETWAWMVGYQQSFGDHLKGRVFYRGVDTDAGYFGVGATWYFGKKEKKVVEVAPPIPEPMPKKVVPVVNVSVMFDYNDNSLSGVAKEHLDHVVAHVKKYGGPIVITGYASRDYCMGHKCSKELDERIQENDYELSLRRAQAVAGYLVSHGVDKDAIEMVTGYGQTTKFGDNKTEETRKPNRRAVVEDYKEKK